MPKPMWLPTLLKESVFLRLNINLPSKKKGTLLMSLNLKKRFPEPEDLTFVKILYCTPIEELLTMDATLISTFIVKTEAVCRWLKGIQKLTHHLKTKGN